MPLAVSPVDAGSAVDGASVVEEASATLIEFIDRLACLAKTHTMDELAATEMTFSQIRVLFALGAADAPMSVNEIAEHVHLSLAAAGRTVDKLVGTGMVDRREDSSDRRVKRVSLTSEGTAFVDSQLNVKKELVRSFVAGLPDALRDDLSQALAPIVGADTDYFDLDGGGSSKPANPTVP